MKNLTKATAFTLALLATHAFAQQSIPANSAATPQAQTAPTYKAKRLDRAELDALLAKPEKLLIIDVRRPDELTTIGGFPVYLNVQAKDLEKYVAFIPK